jgi:hypothetical protein
MKIMMKPHELAGIVKVAILHDLTGLPKHLERFLIIVDLLFDEGRALRYAVVDYLPACGDYLRGKDDPRLEEARRRIGRLGGTSRTYYRYQFRTFADMIRLLAPDMPDQMAHELALQLWHAWVKREEAALRRARSGTSGP